MIGGAWRGVPWLDELDKKRPPGAGREEALTSTIIFSISLSTSPAAPQASALINCTWKREFQDGIEFCDLCSCHLQTVVTPLHGRASLIRGHTASSFALLSSFSLLHTVSHSWPFLWHVLFPSILMISVLVIP